MIDFNSPFWKNKHPLTDSRQVIRPEQCIFFALKGRLQDGHQYIPELYQKGVRCFVLSEAIDQSEYPSAQFIQVDSPLAALQAWAAWHRQQFNLPVLAITGSNGKTIVKEWLYQLLHRDYFIVKSPKSYNSQLGVALSVLQLRPEHQLAVFEAGISQVGEMENLAAIIRPNIGIFTNIGPAHDEGFESKAEKISEKLLLFKDCPYLIYCSDQTSLHNIIEQQLPNTHCLAWGFGPDADIQVTRVAQRSFASELLLKYDGESHSIQVPFSDAASIENALHAVVLMLHLGYALPEIQQRLEQLKNVAMRLEWKEGIQQCMLIDDTYNNDLAGLRIALDFMGQKHPSSSNFTAIGGKTLILSDILESGIDPALLYATVAQWLQDYGIGKLIGIGPELMAVKFLFKNIPACFFFSSTDAFIEAVEQDLHFHQETILIKGARSFEFERIVRLLRKRTHNTVLELDLNALLHNFNIYRQQLRPQTKIMVMVKAFAYGSSSYEVARLLQYHKVDYLGVAYIDEGVQLRQKGITVPIMVMNADAGAFDQLVKYQLEPSIYSPSLLSQFIRFLRKSIGNRPPQPIHIEVDTGMHRLGFAPSDLEWVLSELLDNQNLVNPVAVFSHLAAADESAQQDFSRQQIAEFEQFAARLEEGLQKPLIKHILNSAGISRFPDKQLDMVRLGIGLHGIDPNQIFSHALQAVASLRSVISQIKTVAAGAAVGYGRHSHSSSERRIATIAIGYADGLMRAFGNGVGQVLINGHRCPIVGNICMDMCFVDLTHVEAEEGDDVLIFGPNLPIEVLAEAVGTIPYEILTHISGRVPRVFFEA